MSETKFTPGPWSTGCMAVEDSSCQCRYIFSEGYAGSIAEISKNNGLRIGEGGNDSPPEEEAKANAHLIAASPTMYEALEQAREYIGALPSQPQKLFNEITAVLDAALSLARGETK